MLPPYQVVVSLSIGSMAEAALGSVAGYMTHHCPRPFAVLHVGETEARGTGPLVAPPAAVAAARAVMSGRNLLVPVDGSEESFQSCRWTLDNLYRTGKDFSICRVATRKTRHCLLLEDQEKQIYTSAKLPRASPVSPLLDT